MSHRYLGLSIVVLLAVVAAYGLFQPVRADDRPALVVVVSVDQLAYEYLERFAPGFDPQGIFRQCAERGAWFSNCHHQHAFTYTAPGHAVQLTGAYASTHGIIDNDWFDRPANDVVYCVSDKQATLIGTTGDDKPVSPRALLSDTVGDRMKLANRKAKVFGVAIKDRASILMAGHLADAAFWMSNDGKWITCDYYRPDMPAYLRSLSEPGPAGRSEVGRYAGDTWKLLLPAAKYQHGAVEDSFGERPLFGVKPNFPHELAAASDKNYVKQLAGSPFGNDATLTAAKLVLVQEQLGQDDLPDLLALNFSSNDYVGHSFGPQSLEVEDMTYRTDRQLAEFAEFVDKQLAGRHWVLVITADHAVSPVPEVVQRRGLPADTLTDALTIAPELAERSRLAAKRNPLGKADKKQNIEALRKPLDDFLRQQLDVAAGGPDLVQTADNNQIYLREDHPALRGERQVLAQRLTRDWLLRHAAIAAAVTREQLLSGNTPTKLDRAFRRSFHPKRSGDVLFALLPYHQQGDAGTTHGSPWKYDTHVPLLFLSRGDVPPAAAIPRGRYSRQVSPAAIAATVSRLIGVSRPSTSEEEALPEIVGDAAR